MSDSKHVAVLLGGWSSERDVSLRSGKACADALERRGYRVSRIDAIARANQADVLQHDVGGAPAPRHEAASSPASSLPAPAAARCCHRCRNEYWRGEPVKVDYKPPSDHVPLELFAIVPLAALAAAMSTAAPS